MDCPHCGGASKVVDSRPIVDGIRRRRECLQCGRRFSTHERLVVLEIKVLKSSGKLTEEFRSDKISRALKRVCRGRPISVAQIEGVARSVEAQLVDSGRNVVRSKDIARMVLSALSEIDQVAYERLLINYVNREDHKAMAGQSPQPPEQFSLFLDEIGDSE